MSEKPKLSVVLGLVMRRLRDRGAGPSRENSWMSPKRLISFFGRASWTSNTPTSKRWTTARSTCACSTARFATTKTPIWLTCCGGSRRCWSRLARARLADRCPDWRTSPTASRCSTAFTITHPPRITRRDCPAEAHRSAGGRAGTARLLEHGQDAGAGGPGGLLPARLPAGGVIDRGGGQCHRDGPASAAWIGDRDGRHGL